jgi:lipid-A-disaccharide synthase
MAETNSLPKKSIYIIAGESSGDILGASIVKQLKDMTENRLLFHGACGEELRSQGIESLFDINQINLMGFVEVLPHIFRVKKLIEQTALDVMAKKPDILITIDSPGFTYRVAKRVRELGSKMKMVHVVAPSVWAYKPGRALKYSKIYDHLLALLPFEPPYFEKVGLKATFIGHPILEQDFYLDKVAAKTELGVLPGAKVVVVTPGSRTQEIRRHMPIFKQALEIVNRTVPGILVIFVLAQQKHQDLINEVMKDTTLQHQFSGDKLQAFGAADAALAKSGTNTLEIAASKTPMVVSYKLNFLSYLIIRCMIKIKFASLINIIAGKEILPELLQGNCKPNLIAEKLIELLKNPTISITQTEEAERILESLKTPDNQQASKNAAQKILELL